MGKKFATGEGRNALYHHQLWPNWYIEIALHSCYIKAMTKHFSWTRIRRPIQSKVVQANLTYETVHSLSGSNQTLLKTSDLFLPRYVAWQ